MKPFVPVRLSDLFTTSGRWLAIFAIMTALFALILPACIIDKHIPTVGELTETDCSGCVLVITIVSLGKVLSQSA